MGHKRARHKHDQPPHQCSPASFFFFAKCLSFPSPLLQTAASPASPGKHQNPPLCMSSLSRFVSRHPHVFPGGHRCHRASGQNDGRIAWQRPKRRRPSKSSRSSSRRKSRQSSSGESLSRSSVVGHPKSGLRQTERGHKGAQAGCRGEAEVGGSKGAGALRQSFVVFILLIINQMGARKAARLRRKAGRTKKINH